MEQYHNRLDQNAQTQAFDNRLGMRQFAGVAQKEERLSDHLGAAESTASTVLQRLDDILVSLRGSQPSPVMGVPATGPPPSIHTRAGSLAMLLNRIDQMTSEIQRRL